MCSQRVSIGIDGLNEVLSGGLIKGGAYLIRGGPGSGKTTLGFHFLTTGRNLGEKTLFITLGESEIQLHNSASSQNFDLKDIAFLDLSPNSKIFTESQNYDIFFPMEVDKEALTKKIIEQLEIIEPQRIFLDSMTHFRYLINDAYKFRKQFLSFLNFIKEKKATFLFTSEISLEAPDDDLQFMADGIINLKFSNEERNITVQKFRRSDFRKGCHSMNLTDIGMKVYPIMLPDNYKIEFKRESISSGIPDLDELLQGGLERGSITVFTGPSGVGKTSLGMQFMKEAAGRGENSVVCCFEEAEETLIQRCESINIPVKAMIEKGTLSILTIEPLLNSPEEFYNLVRKQVEENSAKIVMLDSISGYQLCFKGNNLVNHLHALCRYLRNRGVASIIINEVQSITGDFRITETGISYLADNIVFLRYLEIKGELRKSIGVIKKRLSEFEKTVRELEITRYGIKVGKPLTNLRGILTGTPDFINPHNEDYLPESIEKEKLLTKNLQITNKKLQHISIVDGLTNIANRRYFDLRIRTEWDRVQRAEKFIFIMLCDIDFFTLYNDIYGHKKGDDCLKIVAKVINKNAKRAADLAARYGGEEFAVILPETSAKGAVHLGKLIQSDLESCAIPHQGSKISQFVTLSIGIAGVVPNHNISVDQLIEIADHALDQAKKNGRNQVVFQEI